MNSLIVTDRKTLNALLDQGFRVVNEQNNINGEIVWTVIPDDLSFNINGVQASGIIKADGLKLTF